MSLLVNGANLSSCARTSSVCYYKNSHLSHPINGTRLYETSDGEIFLIPKTPAEIVGERILRPAIDGSFSLFNRTAEILKKGFSLFDTIFTKILSPLPMATASEMDVKKKEHMKHQNLLENNEDQDESLTRTNIALEDRSSFGCRAIAFLKKEHMTHQNLLENNEDQDDSLTLTDDSLTPTDDSSPDAETEEGARDILQKSEFSLPEDINSAEGCGGLLNLFEQLINEPILEDENLKEFKKSALSLKDLAEQDLLGSCVSDIPQFFTKLGIEKITLDKWEEIAELFVPFLDKLKTSLTSNEVSYIATSINEVAIHMINVLVNRSDSDDLLSTCLDLMLSSAKKIQVNTDSISKTLGSVKLVLKGNKQHLMKWEERRDVRNIAKELLQKNSNAQGQIANEILQITGITGITSIDDTLDSVPSGIIATGLFVEAILDAAKETTIKIVQHDVIKLLLVGFLARLIWKYQTRPVNRQENINLPPEIRGELPESDDDEHPAN